MILADTGAVLALIDADDAHHQTIRALYESDPGAWVLPWAVLPEIDYLVATRVGRRALDAFLEDLADGVFPVEWRVPGDLERSREIDAQYRELRLGLVDCVVVAIAERTRAEAIATLDLRHFAAIAITGGPRLLPRGRPL